MGGANVWGAGDGVDDKQQDDGGVVVVGYAFMAKKMDSMSKVGVRAYGTPHNYCTYIHQRFWAQTTWI